MNSRLTVGVALTPRETDMGASEVADMALDGVAGIEITLFGPMSVRTSDGEDVTPKGVKARAVLAMLADAPQMRQSRQWLQAHLWSTKTHEQASGSLRQLLTTLRKELGPAADVVGANRSDIWLEEGRVKTDQPAPGAEAPEREYLEGLRVPDPEFNIWLQRTRDRLVRHNGASPPQQTRRTATHTNWQVPFGLPIYCMASEGPPQDRIVAQAVADQIGQNLEEVLPVWRTDSPPPGDYLEVTTSLVHDGDTRVLFARVVHIGSGRVVFTHFRPDRNRTSFDEIEGLVSDFAHEVTTRVTAALPHILPSDREETQAMATAHLARKRLFTYEPGGILEATELMRRARDIWDSGVNASWLAFAKMTEAVECLAPVAEESRDEIEAEISRALEIAPENGEVHALSALVQLMMLDDIGAGVQTAEDALRRNPNSLLVRQTLAVATAASGRHETAYQMSAKCRPGAARASTGHLWDLYHALVCISTGRLDEARAAAHRAVQRSPDFRAPRRLLIGLHAHAGDLPSARQQFSELRQREPDLTPEVFFQDPDYPVRTLREAGLLSLAPPSIADDT